MQKLIETDAILNERSQRNRRGETIPVLKVFMPAAIADAVRDVLGSGYLSEGPKVAEFEARLGEWLGAPHILALNSGSSALQLALRLAGVGPGDEVISTPMTCLATNHPIVLQGTRIRWADVDPATGNLDTQDVRRKINARTRAIMAVHWGGYPCDLAELRELTDAHGLKIIEDACHALGAQYGGQYLGTHSDFVCFSFQAVKIMTTGDGGALACRNPEDAERGRLLRWYGMNRRLDSYQKRQKAFFEQDVREAGYKIHMNDLAAAIGLEQLKYVQENIRKHQAHAARYDAAFAGLKRVRTMARDSKRASNCWLYTLRVDDVAGFGEVLKDEGVDSSPIHVRNDRYTVFEAFREALPGVDAFDAEHICIPVGWWLEDEDVERVVRAVVKYDADAGLRG